MVATCLPIPIPAPEEIGRSVGTSRNEPERAGGEGGRVE